MHLLLFYVFLLSFSLKEYESHTKLSSRFQPRQESDIYILLICHLEIDDLHSESIGLGESIHFQYT